ncbi:target of EGR1 protein 1-like [Brevipalpus obovatus]|uniref:target of EGR1 protein 1-like n=1 Tax=Brevipalpus obovatus TaxID=246614 RepID=UPI003D9F5394
MKSDDMDELSDVPCVQIDKSNVATCWNYLTDCLQRAHFVAIDLELSGLGNKAQLKVTDVEERYKNISYIARTRSILSIGLSFFRDAYNAKEDSPPSPWKFEAINFNIITTCSDDYVLEDDARDFLTSYGFDFEKQKNHGLPYARGRQADNEDEHSIRKIISMINRKLPIIFHNGLIDLIFLYENFMENLPKTMTTFIANLNELFPNGIFDTKYIACNFLSVENSYLAYLFYKSQRDNLMDKYRGQPYITVSFPTNPQLSDHIDHHCLQTRILQEREGVSLCKDYMTYGWCKKLNNCNHSHEVDLILDQEKKSKKQKKILNKLKESESSKEDNDSQDANMEDKKVESSIHRAGYDAFMTGYCFFCLIVKILQGKMNQHGKALLIARELRNYRNSIHLTGKKEPFKVRKSSYTQPTVKLDTSTAI